MKLTTKKNYAVGDVVLVNLGRYFNPETVTAVVGRNENTDDEFYEVDDDEFVQHSQIAGCLEGYTPPPPPWEKMKSDARTAQAVVAEGQGGPCEGSMAHVERQLIKAGVPGPEPEETEVPKTETEKSPD